MGSMTKQVTGSEIEKAIAWLKERPEISIKAIESLKVPELRLSDALYLNPYNLLLLARKTFSEAKKAKAPKDVLAILQARVELTEGGLKKIAKHAYSWMVCAQIRGVGSKAKVRAILTKGMEKAPDARNKALLQRLIASKFNPGLPPKQKAPPCLLCCAMTCLECVVLCPECCVAACLICLLF